MYEKSESVVLRDFISKSYIFVGVMLFEKFENKTPSNITRYTVVYRAYSRTSVGVIKVSAFNGIRYRETSLSKS